jgi:hypothetical protein
MPTSPPAQWLARMLFGMPDLRDVYGCYKFPRACRYGYFEIESRAGSSKVSSSFWFFQSEPTVWTEIDVFELTGEHGSTTLRTQDSMHTHVFRLPNTTSSELPGLCKCTLPSSSMPRDVCSTPIYSLVPSSPAVVTDWTQCGRCSVVFPSQLHSSINTIQQ